ncbi:5-methyltetrahydropteroyltriglutamate--homocysteine S-methyltransferase [Priestia taiwanensis]|uniref:5-methyltetrahydropteroyltriglutamate--homocysteine methyltransferase n=1 Tax=Priestia taiwanensis TaxID=1347902 RepID=A0A917ANM1_9BACI|nr:5-methyltetrahydropteroyltriglutamate--homocysteine S-methyltransferase [Priestia taiwanensis]MBM7362510.1 5-methyltetrahydropteroyltriglutamate--homocysteine methyltransferase [Priestia taiwanensis]GGE62800.1 5-methyltetrahydropteroyltriglutamate--homocysteine methyltransferase [Priestia taiwanensis]
MGNVFTSNLGYPRIGANREWKKTLEAFWAGDVKEEDFLQTMKEIRLGNLRTQVEKGVDLIPVGDFTFYDHVLDMATTFGWVPDRYKHEDGKISLATYFAMARGNKDAVASEMTKWFNTNYHYIVPEYEKGKVYTVTENKALLAYREAKQELGINGKPVIVGPYTFVSLAKGYKEEEFATVLEEVVPLYIQLLQELVAEGVEWVQVDEPSLVCSFSPEHVELVKDVYKRISETVPNIKVLLQTYFDSVEYYEEIVSLPVAGIGLDFVHGKEENVNALKKYGFPKEKVLAVGVIDGRNIWRANIHGVLGLVEEIQGLVEPKAVIIQPSSSLLHVPVQKQNENRLNKDVFNALAFAEEKLAEVTLVKDALLYGKEKQADVLNEGKEALETLIQSATIASVQDAIANVKEADFARALSFEKRFELQRDFFKLPLLPTTTIGSFPQTKEVRYARQQWRKGEWSQEKYDLFVEEETKRWIDIQEELDLDVLVHGEFERTDMVEYFGEKLAGFTFTQFAWVQSYGSRCVKPPIIYGDVDFIVPMTVKESKYAQSLTTRPVKGMLTGPVTILNWSFVRSDISRQEVTYQIALALRKEIEALEEAGIRMIQVDEPALREGLPLKVGNWDHYLTWAVNAFKLSTSSVAPETQIHTHMCYSNFDDIIDAIEALDADVISIEASRSHGEFIHSLKERPYVKGLGLGVYDIHSPRVPAIEEMKAVIDDALEVCHPTKFWVNPDCGLKTRKEEETVASLRRMVEAAKNARKVVTSVL